MCISGEVEFREHQGLKKNLSLSSLDNTQINLFFNFSQPPTWYSARRTTTPPPPFYRRNSTSCITRQCAPVKATASSMALAPARARWVTAPVPALRRVPPAAGRHRHAPASEGRGVVVGWRSKGSEGEHTAPARVSRVDQRPPARAGR